MLFLCVTVYLSNSTPTPISTLRVSRERERAFEIYENDPVLSDCLVLSHIHTHPINTAKREGFATADEGADAHCHVDGHSCCQPTV